MDSIVPTYINITNREPQLQNLHDKHVSDNKTSFRSNELFVKNSTVDKFDSSGENEDELDDSTLPNLFYLNSTENNEESKATKLTDEKPVPSEDSSSLNNIVRIPENTDKPGDGVSINKATSGKDSENLFADNGSTPGVPIMNEDPLNEAIAKEEAFGPRYEKAEWDDPEKFRLPKDDTVKENRKIVSDTLCNLLKTDVNKDALDKQKKEFDKRSNWIEKLTSPWKNVVLCGNYVDEFAKKSQRKREPLKVEPTNLPDELTQKLNAQLKGKNVKDIGRDIEVTSITPYINSIPKHDYLYLKVSIKGEEDLWISTETDGSTNPDKYQGDIHFDAHPVKNPARVIDLVKNPPKVINLKYY